MNAIPKASAVIPIVAWLACITAPSTVLASTQLLVDSAPPPARIENVPHRDGFIWASGHWEWSGRTYFWVGGHYIERPEVGLVWEPGRWIDRHGHWEWAGGHWHR